MRRAYARQICAVLGVDNRAIERAFARVPREIFLGPPPWTAPLPGAGDRPRAGADPVVLYQDLVIALDPKRGVNNGSPSLHAKLLDALGPKPGEHVVHIGAGTGYYSAILAELVGPSGRVTAVEVDPALAKRAETSLSDRLHVQVVCADGARWPQTPVDAVYVNFAVARPADRWVENLASGGRLVFVLGVPGPQRPNSGGRYSERGAALWIERRGNGFTARAVSSAYFVCAEGELSADFAAAATLRAAFAVGDLAKIRSLVWKAPAASANCWFIGADWALSCDPP